MLRISKQREHYPRCILIHVARATLLNVSIQLRFQVRPSHQVDGKPVDRVNCNKAIVVLAHEILDEFLGQQNCL